MEYTLTQINTNQEGLTEVTRFLQKVFPGNKKFTPDFIKWQYTLNPLGKMAGFNAWDNNRIVSHFAGLPIEMNLFGSVRKGLLCINVSTDIRYRGRKLFTAVGQKTIEYAAESGYDFLIAVPNANSTHGFLRHFGFYFVAPLAVRVGLGKNIYTDRKFNCYKSWSEEQWKWRLSNPANTYYSDSGSNVFTPISSLFKTFSTGRFSGSFPKNVLPDAGVRPFNLYIGLGADTSKGLYSGIPPFIKRPPFNLVFKDLKGEMPLVKKEDVFLQLIDLDTI